VRSLKNLTAFRRESVKSFAQSLYRYLTTPPESNDEYFELIYNNYSEEFLEDFEDSELENKWINKLCEKDIDPVDGAKIIERAYRLYTSNII
jgi:hypothetical protein